MNYGTAESELVQRLNGYFESKGVAHLYEASLMPDTEDGFRTFYNNFTKARVAVEFIESVPQPAQALGNVTQDEIVRFRLTFEARKLRGEGGFYNMAELVKLAIIGYRLVNSTSRLTLYKYGLLEFEQNKIQPYYEFECRTTNVQAFNDFADDEPLAGVGEARVKKVNYINYDAPSAFGQEFENSFQ